MLSSRLIHLLHKAFPKLPQTPPNPSSVFIVYMPESQTDYLLNVHYLFEDTGSSKGEGLKSEIHG